MAAVTEPGFSGFNAELFRRKVRATMTMGLPGTVSDRATFRWKPEKTYTTEDEGHSPYSWTSVPTTSEQHEDVQVPCAVEYSKAEGIGTSLGQFEEVNATLTLLDEDYAQVEGANFVLLAGNLYQIDYVTKVALFDVDVMTLTLSAVDESA